MNKKYKIAIVVGALVAVSLATYFNKDTTYVTNIPDTLAVQNEVQKTLTPEEMIEKVTKNIEVKSVKSMADNNTYVDYVDFMQGEIAKMTTEADRLYDIASTSKAELTKATDAYVDLRDLLKF